MTRKFKRQKKLIRPGLQLRLTAAFAGVVVLTVCLQTLLVTSALMRTASELPNAGRALQSLIPEMVTQILLVSVLLIAPLTIAVGVLGTFRIAGPVYRFETFLKDVAEGRQVEPCSIRSGDELHSLCDAINRATESVRQRAGEQRDSELERPQERAAG